MDNKDKTTIEVMTTFDAHELISETIMKGPGKDQMTVIQRQVLKHQEEGVIEGLKRMGWIPPVDIEFPLQGLDIDQLKRFYGVTTPEQIIAAQARHIERLQAKINDPMGLSLRPSFPRG